MGYYYKNELKNGVSYRLRVKVKDLRTGKYVQRTMTWRKPDDMPEDVAEYEVKKVLAEFQDRAKKQSMGLLALDSRITFIEYATHWIENIPNTRSMNYYVKARGLLKKFEKYFGYVKLCEINPIMIQGFIDEMCKKGYEHRSAVLKDVNCFNNYLKANKIKKSHLGEKLRMGKSTFSSLNERIPVRVESAERICSLLDIKFDDCFEIIETFRPYAKETIQKAQRLISAILASAKRKRLVENNYATREYIEQIRGTKKEVRILNIEEARKLLEFLETADVPIRWKMVVYIPLYLGLRRGEIAGLEWKDIDFDKKILSVRRTIVDVGTYGKFVKEPKTLGSIRDITIPDALLDKLKIYKEWWEETASFMGDRWRKTDRLFCSNEGGNVSMHLFITWLHKILRMADLPIVTMHALRHTNITIQLVSGVDLKTVSARAGHARASTTSDIYSHYLRTPDYQASEVLDKILGIKNTNN